MYEDRSFLYFCKNNFKVNFIDKDSNEYFNPISVTNDDYIYIQLNSENEGFTLNRCDLDSIK
jgi:hypothetical protein